MQRGEASFCGPRVVVEALKDVSCCDITLSLDIWRPGCFHVQAYSNCSLMVNMVTLTGSMITWESNLCAYLGGHC